MRFTTIKDLYDYYFNKITKGHYKQKVDAQKIINALAYHTNTQYDLYFNRYGTPVLFDHDYIDYLENYLNTELSDDKIREIFETENSDVYSDGIYIGYHIETYVSAAFNDTQLTKFVKEFVEKYTPTARWKGEGFGDYSCSLCGTEHNGKLTYCPHCLAKMN